MFQYIYQGVWIAVLKNVVLIHFCIIETEVCKTVARLRQERYATQ